MKKILVKLWLILTFLTFPLNTFAYSDYIIPGGENIGIDIKTDGIMIIGFYKVNGSLNKGNLKVGDQIIKVEDIEINTVDDLVKAIDQKQTNNSVNITFKRNNKLKTTNLKLIEENDILKTGLYVKDSLTGIGTLTYIDPETKIYGALGHEVLESSSKEKVEVKTGYIFKSLVTSIERSSDGNPGGKNARFYYNTKYGNILKNTSYGIYGTYEEQLPNKETLKVASSDEIELGKAKILTVLHDETIEEFEINIIKISEDHHIKNLVFEITDEKLLEKTGGIVQGMSGSPIIQNDKIIGAVTHVFVEDTSMGYGIFITTMLEEGEK